MTFVGDSAPPDQVGDHADQSRLQSALHAERLAHKATRKRLHRARADLIAEHRREIDALRDELVRSFSALLAALDAAGRRRR